MSSNGLEGNSFVVVGGSSGIGLATAELLCSNGARVTVADVQPPPRRENLSYVETDARDEDDLVRALDMAYSRFDSLSGVSYCAGVQIAQDVDELSRITYRNIFDTNTWGAMLTTKVASGYLTAGDSLVLVASVAGLTDGGPGLGLYAASKGAVISFARHAAKELAPVRVNSVSPGWTDTTFNRPVIAKIGGEQAQRELVENTVPLRRQAHPKEIASAVAFLLGTESSYLTGTNLVVDGGLTI